MTLRLRHLRMRAHTPVGPFGADITFRTGLNVLWAENTTGKSTCLQGFLYALGLERMLSPRREIPLAYVMRSHLDDPDTNTQHRILESSVWVELENGAGEIITVRRYVVGSANPKLVSVFEGPLLTQPIGHYQQRDYFVLDPGAAQREAGFHRMLADFIGWSLPVVKRYDGSETLLYVETIFPLLYVEQKSGWSSIPGAIPTYFQIRDVSRRAVEFVMQLETHDLELQRQQLELDIAATEAAWSAKREELQTIARLVNARMEAIPVTPTISATDVERGFLLVPEAGDWYPLEELASLLRGRVAELRKTEIPRVEDVAPEIAARHDLLATTAAELNAKRNALFRSRQLEVAQRSAIEQRLLALDEDLQKNIDAEKLRSFGSDISKVLSAEFCPTCAQPISDSLLPQNADGEIMTVEDNIAYIRSQREIFRRIQGQSERTVGDIERQLASLSSEVNEISAELRALRADMVAPAHMPSTAVLETRLRTEARLQTLEDVLHRFEQQKAALGALVTRYSELVAARSLLPTDRFTEEDRRKLVRLGMLVRDQTNQYGFKTFQTSDIDISEENYRPQARGFEIGFELSASDAIRLKWAYQLALMELGRSATTNHPGFVVFDEPRQQETAKISFRHLLKRAATAKAFDQQVIFATSEDRSELELFLAGLDSNLIAFEGPIVKRL